MNPNSTHQLWSRWTADVTVPFHTTHLNPMFLAEMKRGTATYYRRLFGSASEMKLVIDPPTHGVSRFRVLCRTEGPPANDPLYRQMAMDDLAKFFGKNLRRYGKVRVRVDVHIEAGDPGTGQPASQLIIAPPIYIERPEGD